MQYEEFLERLQNRAGLESQEEARQAAEATLETLGERIARKERADVASELPRPLFEFLTRRPPEDLFDLEEFYNRVSARADVGYPEAVRLARAAVEVLKEAISEGQELDVLFRLPEEFDELFGRKTPGASSPTYS
jgi:uncharacterized protein (DUF2267 family)